MRKLPRRYLLIPIVYIGFVLLLLSLALFGRGFSHDVEGVKLSGKYAPFPLFGAKTIRELTLSYNGLRLQFSRRTPLMIETGDEGTRAVARLEALESYSGGADIIFENGYRFRLMGSSEEEETFTISLLSPPGAGAALSVVIPFTLRGTLGQAGDAPLLAWTQGSREYALSLPAPSRVDVRSRAIDLTWEAGPGSRDMRLGRTSSPAADSYATWLSGQAALVGPDELRATTREFLDAAYKGWRETRLASEGNLWMMPDANPGFREEIGVALIAESIPRGEYLGVRGLYADALARQIQREPNVEYAYSASPFIGNLRAYSRRQQAMESLEIERMRALISRSDSSVFTTPAFVPFLIDHGPFSLVQDLLTFMQDRDASRMDSASALGLLEALLDYTDILAEKDICPRKCREVIDKSLLPSVKSTDKGLFLQAKTPGQVDVKDSIRCGALLIRAGESLGNESLVGIGRNLIASSLRLKGESGILPETLTVSSGSISSRKGSVSPESVYPHLPAGRMLPREIPLYSQIGPNAWIWTAASLESAQSTEAVLRFAFSFPKGLPHYVLIQGIKPFSAIQMHGIPWRSDPSYAQYSDGWFYEALTRTLYLKLTHTQEKEEITISY